MTTFSKKEIDKLVRLHLEELGIKISEEEACQYAAQLIDLLLATYRENSNNSPP